MRSRQGGALEGEGRVAIARHVEETTPLSLAHAPSPAGSSPSFTGQLGTRAGEPRCAVSVNATLGLDGDAGRAGDRTCAFIDEAVAVLIATLAGLQCADRRVMVAIVM